jgi:hypothetical protein
MIELMSVLTSGFLDYVFCELTNSSSARGNTTLESAVTLTKALRWDIQALGMRLSNAASAEETSRRNKDKARSRSEHEFEIRLIVQDIKKLLTRIEDAVPLINLAITTSGVSLSTNLPAAVSPSRLLQASTFLTAGDTQYSLTIDSSVQVGPSFTLSLYMLFAGHDRDVDGANYDMENLRYTMWKEVIHKARVRLVRIPLDSDHESQESLSTNDQSGIPLANNVESLHDTNVPGEGRASEFAYQIEIIEDLDDDRVHDFEPNEPQPGPYGEVELAGIREFLPIHQISKIFYADTGKILNIGDQGETNNPVLLLKRDINALPPRRMMHERERNHQESYADPAAAAVTTVEDEDSQDDIDQQIRRESSLHIDDESTPNLPPTPPEAWCLPSGLDPEWLALEVYTEAEDTGSEDDQEIKESSEHVAHRPSSSEDRIASTLADLHLKDTSSSPTPSASAGQVSSSTPFQTALSPKSSPFGPIRSSLSLMEMLIRLTALQQFQQASHLSIPDELLNFFLEDSSTIGAGRDGEARRRARLEARQKVGFDPYDESPIKRHGEDYQQNQGHQGQEGDNRAFSRDVTPYDDYDQRVMYGGGIRSPGWAEERSRTPQGTPQPWLLRNGERSTVQIGSPDFGASSPVQSYPPSNRRPLDRVRQDRVGKKSSSPLGRGKSVDTDSSLGTSPGSPTPANRVGKGSREVRD